MAVYEYQAIAKTTGKRVKGVIDADSAAAARRKLRDQNMFPTKVAESFEKAAGGKAQPTGGTGLGRISTHDIALLTRQLAVLLQAGMPLVEGLTALIDQTSNARLKKVVYDLRDKVNSGMRLADALRNHKRVFSELYINMVGAGEASGALEQVLFRLSDIMERQVKLTRRIRATLAYPALMAVVGTGVITFLMVVIVPRITDMFEKQDRELPLITKMLIATCNFLSVWWPVIAFAIILLLILWRLWIARPQGRMKWDAFKLRVPGYRALYVKLLAGRVARTLGTMLSSGLTMMTSLEVVKSVVQNKVVENAMDSVKADVRRGKDLSIPLRDMGIFPPMMISMVELGQRSGELESMMIKVADTYDDEVETNVDALVSLLEPVMILVMATFVGFLVVSILLPILDMSSGF